MKLSAEYPVNENDYHTEDSLCKIGLLKAKKIQSQGTKLHFSSVQIGYLSRQTTIGPSPSQQNDQPYLIFSVLFSETVGRH